MNQNNNSEYFEEKRIFFDNGNTKSLNFRTAQLKALKKSLLDCENEIYAALNSDLGKSETESFFSEFGIVISEIDHALKSLKSWMVPEKREVPIALEPSSCEVRYEPKGVVLIISPWNYPIMLTAVPLIGAIAAGNCSIIKPSEDAPASSAIMKKIISATFEKEFISLVQGVGHELVPRLMTENIFNHVFFTGSTEVGREIAKLAAINLVSTTLELGGKSPAIIDDTANLKVSAKRIIWGKLLNAGQTCVSPDYLLIQESIKDEFIKYLIEAIEDSFGVNQLQSKDYPRIINQKRFDKVASYLNDGRILFGGDSDKTQLYIQPTLMDQMNPDSPIMRDEIFGPILPIITFKSNQEIIDMVRKNRYPLACYYFGKNKERESLVMNEIEFGGGCINNTLVHLGNPDLPFGGVMGSGSGHYHGWYSFECFSNTKGIVNTATWLDPDFKYPPYTQTKNRIIKTVLKLG